MKIFLLACICIILSVGFAAIAQRPYDNRNPNPGYINPYPWLDRDQANAPLSCSITKRINRSGEIMWLRMDCRRV